MKKYVRDKRSPVPGSENVSRVMSANRAGNTGPELALRKALWNEGLRGYRLHYRKVPGRPDIAFVRHKLALFVNGCYWHRCPKCALPMPKNNTAFWKEKFRKNVERDKKKLAQLQDMGWKVLVIWECELKKDIHKVVGKVKNVLF